LTKTYDSKIRACHRLSKIAENLSGRWCSCYLFDDSSASPVTITQSLQRHAPQPTKIGQSIRTSIGGCLLYPVRSCTRSTNRNPDSETSFWSIEQANFHQMGGWSELQPGYFSLRSSNHYSIFSVSKVFQGTHVISLSSASGLCESHSFAFSMLNPTQKRSAITCTFSSSPRLQNTKKTLALSRSIPPLFLHYLRRLFTAV